MKITRIGPDDWEQFRAVRLASLADAPAAFGSRHEDWVDASEARWRARLTDVPLTLLAHDAGDVIGIISGLHEAEHWAEIISVWVAPVARGTGAGDALVAAVADWAAADGRSTYLMVRSDNARARTAYERAGFVDLGVPEGWPSDHPPEHRMERRL